MEETFGAALRRLRGEAGLSQPRLAALANWSQSRISRAEHDQFVPLPDIAGHLDRVLNAEGTLIALQATAAAERPPRQGLMGGARSTPLVCEPADAEGVDATDRREVLQAVAVGFGAVLAEPAARIIAAADEPSPPAHIAISDVAELERQTTVLQEWDQVVGGVAARHALLGTLRWATSLRDSSCAPAVRARLTAAVARLADVAGWAVSDAGLYGPARHLYLLGIDAARESGDMAMLAHVAGGFARIQVHAGKPDSALDLVRLAQSGADMFTPPMRAMLHITRAEAYAKIPGQSEACRRHLDLAEDCYVAPGRDDPEWIGFFTPATLEGNIGGALYDLLLTSQLHDPSLSDRLTAAVDRHPSSRVRAKAGAATRLANTLFLAREPEEASRRAMIALDLVGPVKSARLAEDLRTTGKLTRRFPSVTAATEVQHRLPGVLAAMT